MSHSKSNGPAWLPLGQAAKRLGVHPTTLRRWAENGDFPVMVTPGGHRRFASTDLERFAQDRSRPAGQGPMPDGWQAWAADRLGIRWIQDGPAAGKRLGTADVHRAKDCLLDLLTLVPGLPDVDADTSVVRTKSARLSHEVVSLVCERGVSLTECIEMTQYLRETLPAIVLSNPALEASGGVETGIRQYLSAAVDGVELAVAQVWEGRNRSTFGGSGEPRRYSSPARYRS